MSLSNPQTSNPASKYLRWAGSEGKIVHYDKETEQIVAMPIPFEFIVLDQLSTITGYNEATENRYWSNEVRSVRREPLTVRTNNGIEEVGLYADLRCRLKGAKYAQSIYIYAQNQTMNFKAHGAALTSWIEIGGMRDLNTSKVRLVGSEEAKKGTTVYYIPKFEVVPATEDELQPAIEADKQLQQYLAGYFNARQTVDEAESPQAQQEVVLKDIDDQPISLDEIPF